MPFQKIQAEKLSQSVVRQIELLILRGILRPGERLPSERDLSDKFGVSRPSLRGRLPICPRGSGRPPGAGIFLAEFSWVGLCRPADPAFASHEMRVRSSPCRAWMALPRRAALLGSDTDLQFSGPSGTDGGCPPETRRRIA